MWFQNKLSKRFKKNIYWDKNYFKGLVLTIKQYQLISISLIIIRQKGRIHKKHEIKNN